MKNRLVSKKILSASDLTKLYVFALSAVAILSITGQLLVQQALIEESRDAYIINMAGRQRMLSQKICKGILLLEHKQHQDQKDYLEELKKAFALWQSFHYGLYYRKAELGFEGSNSEKITGLFRELDPYYSTMADNVKRIMYAYSAIDTPAFTTAVEAVLNNEDQFLILMNEIVLQYEIEAREKISSLRKTELMLLGLTLLVLLFEGMFVFRPAAARIRKSMLDLMESESRTNASNQRLRETQEELEKTNDQLELRIKDRTKEISRKNEELARVNKDLDNFIYTASHDLKAPISNIEGLVEALSREVPLESEASQGMLAMMKTSVDKFRDVLKELSDTGKAKMEAGGYAPAIQFKKIMEEIKGSIRGLLDNAGAVIEEDFSAAPQVRFSQKNLRSILYNLVTNAVKYKSPERRPLVKVFTEKQEGYIVLRVIDNGIGIKHEDLFRIFSMYTRLEENIEGTGVGLSIVKRIVDNSGGKIEVQSQPGMGSSFSVYFKDKS